MLLVKFQLQPAFHGRGEDPQKSPKLHFSILARTGTFLNSLKNEPVDFLLLTLATRKADKWLEKKVVEVILILSWCMRGFAVSEPDRGGEAQKGQFQVKFKLDGAVARGSLGPKIEFRGK